MGPRWIAVGILLVVTTAVGFRLVPAPATHVPASEAQAVAATGVETGQIAPDGGGQAALAMAPSLSPTQLERLQIRKLQMREQMAAFGESSAASPAALPLVAGRATTVTTAAAQFLGDPATLVIGRNDPNTNPNNQAKGSSLAEPAAA